MKDVSYQVTNISGQEMDISFVDSNLNPGTFSIPHGETLDDLSENAIKYFWQYEQLGAVRIDKCWGYYGKPNWKKEGF